MPTTDLDRPVGSISDEELTMLALAADPGVPLADDAVPFEGLGAPDGLLPSWYMPAPVACPRTPARTVAAILVISGFALINVLGLCITYGTLTAG